MNGGEASRGEAVNAAERGLDVLNLSVANIQTGFGPFIAVYLTTAGWTDAAIGIALSFGTIVAMISQIPAGALVDMSRRKSVVAALSLLAFTASALLFALWPQPLPIYLAEALHGVSSCTLSPAVAAMSLALAGQAALGQRLGRNARWSAIGNAVGAALMGAVGYELSSRAVFFLAALLTLPALGSIWPLRALDPYATYRQPPAGRQHPAQPGPRPAPVMALLTDRRLLIFALCAMLFTFANAAMLPLAGSAFTKQMPARASLLIAAFIVLPQIIVAAASPAVGRYAQSRGRRIILVLGLAALALRGLLFATIGNPLMLLPVQALDGVSGACFGVLVPLVTADVAGLTRHYNLALGTIGLLVGFGATASTTVAGLIADRYGEPHALLALALSALAATLFAWRAMPETKPAPIRVTLRELS